MINFVEKDKALFLLVKIVPRASKSEIVGEHDGALKVRIAAPPIDGAANAELVNLLAKTFGVAKSAIEITSGQTSKIKQIKITNPKGEKFLQLLNLK